MTNIDERLNKVYSARDAESLEAEYDTWAADYDADLFSMGYVYPGIMAGMVCRHVQDRDARILDIGAGTGLAAWYLNPLGYRKLTALDMSEGMLAVARDSGFYDHVQRDVLGEPLNYPDDAFDAGISSGTFTAQHAPVSAFDEVFRVIRPGGVFIVSMRVDSGVSDRYKQALAERVEAGSLELIDQSEETPAFLLAHDPEEAKVRGQIFAYRLAD